VDGVAGAGGAEAGAVPGAGCERSTMMKRRMLMVLLAIGTVGGYASGFAHMHACHRARTAAFEHHVAEVCVDAANHGTKGATVE